jgi:predicted site-specific integrase-resolvase
MSLRKFCREAGISDVTAWRWRRRGWLVTINICGKQYITGEALTEFMCRAQSGEFAKQPKVPKPRT